MTAVGQGAAAAAQEPAKVTVHYFDENTGEAIEAPDDVLFYDFEKGPQFQVPHKKQKDDHRQIHGHELKVQEEMLVGVKIGELTAAIPLKLGDEVIAHLPVRTAKPETQTATITVRVEEPVQTGKGQEQRKPVQHATVSAKPVAVLSGDKPKPLADSERIAISAHSKEGLAVLEVRTGCLYELSVTALGPYAGARQRLPVLIPVYSSKNIDLNIVVEPYKKTLKLLFVDTCGQKMKRTGFFIGSTKYLADEQGEREIEIGTLGKLQLWSNEHNFSPSEIQVGQDLAQAIVVTVAKPGLADIEGDFLDEKGLGFAHRRLHLHSESGHKYELETDEKGHFIQRAIPKGRYKVFAEEDEMGSAVPALTISVV